jgi:hypothetical protein
MGYFAFALVRPHRGNHEDGVYNGIDEPTVRAYGTTKVMRRIAKHIREA